MILALLFACGPEDADSGGPGDTAGDTAGDTDDTGTSDPDDVTLEGTCAHADAWGRFTVDANEDYAYVAGSVSDGVVPASVLTPALVSGECTIWRRENPFCETGCEPGYTCDFDGTCVPYPETQDLGVVEVDGLAVAVAMSPVSPGYSYFDTSLPNPPWEAGAVVELTTGGGAYAPATLHGIAPADLVPTTMDWTIPEAAAFEVSWDAPGPDARTEVTLTLRIDQHGITPSSVECVFADDGAAEVPADVLAELMAYGVSGFPEGSLARRTADRADIGDGCVDLVLTSSRLAFVDIEGYTPCNRDEECPDGQTCNEAMQRCE